MKRINVSRRFLIASVAAVLAGAFTGVVSAQAYPNKPVKLVVPFAPGGSTDIIARILAEKLSHIWKQPVVIENKPGAGGNIASDLVAKSPPDGYTILVGSNTHVINASLYSNLPYDPIKDFTAIAGSAYYSLVLVVNPSLPVNSFKEFISYAKANPGRVTFGSAGTGTPTHLANELLKNSAGIDIVHSAYKGAAPATTDLLGGHIQAMFNNPVSALPLIRTGKLRALATTGLKRSPTLPNVPTVAESGYPDFVIGSWLGLLGPAKLAKEVVNKISADITTVLKMPDVIEKFGGEGIETWPQSPAHLAQIMVDDQKKWGKVIKDGNIKLD